MRVQRTFIVSLLAGVLLTAGPGPAAAEPTPALDGPRGTSASKSLVIGIDGAGLTRIRAANTPVLHRLMRQGTSSLTYTFAAARHKPGAAPLPGPGWASVLTGGWPELHGVLDDTFRGNRLEFYPDYLTRAERRRPRLSTFSVTDWTPLGTSDEGGPLISDEVDRRVAFRSGDGRASYVRNDQRSVNVAARHLRANGPDASFVYLGKTGQAARAHGAASPEYARSLEADDQHVGRLLQAIQSRPTYGRERWQIIVTNSHGYTAAGRYGGYSPNEREQFIIARGPGLPRGVRRNLFSAHDVAASVFDHLRLGPTRWGYTGSPLRKIRDFRFSGGWRVDNSKMPGGGVQAWRGWQLTTQKEWSAADRGEGREDFVHGRGVIAVADSDEWADAEREPGDFESVLISPPYDVKGFTRRQISFEGHYDHEPSSSACVSVRFNGGPLRELRCSASDGGSGTSGLPVDVPSGANTMRIYFKHRGDDDYFWAIDDVRVCAVQVGRLGECPGP